MGLIVDFSKIILAALLKLSISVKTYYMLFLSCPENPTYSFIYLILDEHYFIIIVVLNKPLYFL